MITFELNDEEYRLVLDLIETRIPELHSEIRRSQTHGVHDELAHDLEALKALRVRLEHAKAGAVAE